MGCLLIQFALAICANVVPVRIWGEKGRERINQFLLGLDNEYSVIGGQFSLQKLLTCWARFFFWLPKKRTMKKEWEVVTHKSSIPLLWFPRSQPKKRQKKEKKEAEKKNILVRLVSALIPIFIATIVGTMTYNVQFLPFNRFSKRQGKSCRRRKRQK